MHQNAQGAHHPTCHPERGAKDSPGWQAHLIGLDLVAILPAGAWFKSNTLLALYTKLWSGSPDLRSGAEAAEYLRVPLGGEKLARFLMRGALVGALGLGDRVQLELGADVDYAPGGTTALLLIGGPARGLVRF